MKIQTLAVLACAASLFAQAPDTTAQVAAEPPIQCRVSFNAIKDTYPRDAAADRIYATVEARVRSLEDVSKENRKGQLYEAEERTCELSVELLKTQFAKVSLRKSIDSLNKANIIAKNELSLVKDTLIDLWYKDALGAKSLSESLSEERDRLERLAKEKEKLLAEKDSLLAVQKLEAEKKLNALHSKTINVYRDARGTILSMSDILFETGKANLTQELQLNLTEIAAILKTLLTESKVTIEGHTDNTGGADLNQKLSEQRADAVMQFLIERGVEKERLEAVGYGFSKPIAENSDPEGRAKNRRVELVIKDN